MVFMRRAALVAAALGLVSLMAAPSGVAITGGSEDTNNNYSNVGLVVFYQPEGLGFCSGTRITPTVVLTAGHCTTGDVGKVIVTFDPVISRSVEELIVDLPRAADDESLDDLVSEIGYTATDISLPKYQGEQTWFLGTSQTHPQFNNFGNLNDVGVVLLESAPPLSAPTATLPPPGFLNQFGRTLARTEFLNVGYGSEVRKPESGPQRPTAFTQPLVRRFTTVVGQKLTSNFLQANGNFHDTRAGGGACFGDSGGPLIYGTYQVGVFSYIRNIAENCRYLLGYQRLDIPIVRDWVASFLGN